MSTINSVLKQLDLNDKEIKIYISLLQSGPSSVQNISRATSISRSTVYQRLENLKKLGVVFFEHGEKGQVMKAIHPEKLKEIIESRVEKSKRLASEYENILPELVNIYQPTSTKAKVIHFEGIEGIRRMIYNYEMEAKDRNIYGYTVETISNLLGSEFIKKYHDKFIKKNYRDHFIMSDNAENKKYFDFLISGKSKLFNEKRIIVKTLPQDKFLPKVTTSIYDDKYAIALMKEAKPFGVIIQNAEIAEHQLEIFKILWNQAVGI